MTSKAMLWAGVVALGLLTACQQGPAANAATASNTTSNNFANSAQPAAAAPAAPAAPTESRQLRLIGGGLQVGEPGLHSGVSYAFGMPRAEIIAAISSLRGAPTEEGSNEECGAGPMQFTHFGPLVLKFQQGRWVGWGLRDRGTPPIATEDGLSIGSTRASLNGDERDQVSVSETTLGTEFTFGEISGLLSGRGPRATVTSLWAGMDCAFR